MFRDSRDGQINRIGRETDRAAGRETDRDERRDGWRLPETGGEAGELKMYGDTAGKRWTERRAGGEV